VRRLSDRLGLLCTVALLAACGSSAAADPSNDENVLIVHNAQVAQAFFAEWQKVWMLSEK
jgi:hypothetical protein